ncbi:4-hydroxyproline epimerase [Pseudoalteromonas luteoviolacea]|uniref:Hydroxyproline-2-epimerase n=1 Tax=Pseudoalteromonas luteoviolacea S4054 TaxID=1129367 RepID=A0A0F6A8W1_9GAMM|nr:4-hydroxyproline epimerase [Pseudoalteromonas luteoviolacea]AOT07791.1 hydroxyproline-2-epimerase [Pseudoalteromonas luteoviolacea]AOT12707.1 hydroxyproline-2-epimerase [Pseudoalteromonas luteoviolacea]AOT17620.1 hydroxyproline-2-epimerase [Pseudoalteromonas luteoviolacea]KKE82276.1 hydroxyproline-2-epimerase [Pseudoalteromonas luteoviolacea S4054]KZN78928.1 hydroxyproline-2-epimerase [Pseudoalteromonas luteoviolacea S4047-1]
MNRGTFFCIDGHTCGNPVRLVTSGHPALRGATMADKRQHFLAEFDWIRKALMFEPRGHDMMSGAFLYPPCSEDGDISILFIETSGCLPMCGHGTIGAITFALELGLIHPQETGLVKIDTPAGRVDAQYKMRQGKVEWVRLVNVPAFLAHTNESIHIDTLGELTIDIAYGGNFYIIVEPQGDFKGIESTDVDTLIKMSREVRDAVNATIECIHPESADVRGATHVLWTGKPQNLDSTAANAVFYGDKAIDRSPCGTGTSARMAQLFTKGHLNQQQDFVHESYIGSQFIGRVEEVLEISGKLAIRPSIQGWAVRTGKNCITVDDDDPYAFGFQVI